MEIRLITVLFWRFEIDPIASLESLSLCGNLLPSMLRLTLLTCAFALGTFAAQIPIYGEEPFLHPETSPISISSDVHTTITHASLPNHSVRIKNTTGFCDVTKSYTGYLGWSSNSFHRYLAFLIRTQITGLGTYSFTSLKRVEFQSKTDRALTPER